VIARTFTKRADNLKLSLALYIIFTYPFHFCVALAFSLANHLYGLPFASIGGNKPCWLRAVDVSSFLSVLQDYSTVL
jgi:hypothetical protein